MASELSNLPLLMQEMQNNFGDTLRVLKVSELEKSKLIFVQDGNHGEYRPLQDEFVECGVPFVRPPNLVDGRINFENCQKINEVAFSRVRKGIGKGGDVILTHNATIGRVAITKDTDPIFVTNPQTTVWRSLDRNFLDNNYLYFFMKSTGFQEQLLSHTGRNATFDYVSLTKQRSLDIPILPISIQKTIGKMLRVIDDKIELNRQMNETLEAMAQALFTSWFVDFDPVIDNSLAAGNPIPDELLERAEQRKTIEKKDNVDIQNLFPNEFEFTEEMGWIPQGWEVTPVYDVAEFINGSSFKSQYFSDENEGLPIIKIAEIKNGVSQQTKFTTQEMPEKYFIDDGSILFSWSGNPDTSIDTFIWTGGEGWLNQHIFNVVLHKNSDRTFVYYLLKMLKPVFTEIARDKQTTGLGHVTIKDMKRTYTIKPSALALEAFELNSNPIFERWYQNLFSSRELAKLRDTLLPKLMSGELRITDAVALVDEVL